VLPAEPAPGPDRSSRNLIIRHLLWRWPQLIRALGFDTCYRTWCTRGSPIVLVPGAFETTDTFAALGSVLGTDHRTRP